MASYIASYESLPEATTTTTGPNTVGLNSGTVSLAAGTYLVFWQADVSTSAVTVAANVSAKTETTTPTTLAQDVILQGLAETTPFDYFAVGGAYLFTLAATTSVTHKIYYGPESTGTGKIKNQRFAVLLLDSADKSAVLTNYVAGTDQVTTTSTTAASTGLSLTFTPATSGDYLVMAFAETNNSTTTATTRLLITDGTSSVETGAAVRRTTDYNSNAIIWKRTYAASSQTITLQHRTTTATTSTGRTRRMLLVALRLDTFANVYATALGSNATTTSTAYTTALSQSNYMRAQPHLTLWAWTTSGGSTTTSYQSRAVDGDGTVVSEDIRENQEGTNSRWNHFAFRVTTPTFDGFTTQTQTLQHLSESSSFISTMVGGNGAATIVALDLAVQDTLKLKATQTYAETLYLRRSTLKATQAYAEALYQRRTTLKATQAYVEIIRSHAYTAAAAKQKLQMMMALFR